HVGGLRKRPHCRPHRDPPDPDAPATPQCDERLPVSLPVPGHAPRRRRDVFLPHHLARRLPRLRSARRLSVERANRRRLLLADATSALRRASGTEAPVPALHHGCPFPRGGISPVA